MENCALLGRKKKEKVYWDGALPAEHYYLADFADGLECPALRFLRPNEAAEAAVPRTCPLMSHYERDFWGGIGEFIKGIDDKTVRR